MAATLFTIGLAVAIDCIFLSFNSTLMASSVEITKEKLLRDRVPQFKVQFILAYSIVYPGKASQRGRGNLSR